ncbi:zinc carboxypeptidase [Pedobacter sp. HMF7647]|uniref:Zinc carboxypeptidase n=1 Tax=Hufsiella arboris TaxID=2695275 RepID=A0A7K1Y740_9SPHI|nr:M14 family metallopeptidase [Hufsiella arboris]MXV49868.1 zinc carboxypeptidase [Hufsiella arboris]
MKKILFFCTVFLISASSFAQSVKSPDDFLGYKLGDQFTPHYKIVEYFKYLASVSKNIKVQEYGKTNEGRPLMVAFIGSDENINRLEEIRHNNLKLTGIESGAAAAQPVITWLSYNVHGNEPTSSEASMKTAFALLDPANQQTKEWLKNTLVVIDPCLNPDGRDRYANFYNSVRGSQPDATPFSREHREPWPGGRANHYYFDLNRDWAWQTQVESKQRVALFNQWLPEIHVDFHEQGYDQPYYFAPAAEPFHQNITKWQREFQVVVGKNNAKYFDQNGWMYFTRERFDLLYPSYGDTYPIYNGSIGMTYEQGGISAGLAVVTRTGDTLTLKDRIQHHYTTGLSTVEVASKNAEKLISEFKTYFINSKNSPPGKYKTFIIKNDNPEKVKALTELLDRNRIEYGYGSSKSAHGFNYLSGKDENFSIDKNDLVVNAYQPKAVLVNVLFEPRTFVSDSITYDITAWSLPYAYGLKAFATTSNLQPLAKTVEYEIVTNNVSDPVAYVANWNSLADVKFLVALLNRNIKVRYSEIPFQQGGKSFNAGSLLIAKTSNESLGNTFGSTIADIAKASGVTIQAISSGFVDKGSDLGSPNIRFIKKPRVAIISGEETSSLAFGEVWQFFDQQLKFSSTVIKYSDLERADLGSINVLIFPDGSYDEVASDRVMQWVRSGGRLIAMGDAVASLAGKKGLTLKEKDQPEEKDTKTKELYASLKPYQNRERDDVRSGIPGAIYKVELDNTHPLAFGFPKYYYTLKLDSHIYKFLDNGWNVGVLKRNELVSGFVGTNVIKKLTDGMLFGAEDIGRGNMIYLADDLLFRSFWENGKLLFSNAVFMVGQ